VSATTPIDDLRLLRGAGGCVVVIVGISLVMVKRWGGVVEGLR